MEQFFEDLTVLIGLYVVTMRVSTLNQGTSWKDISYSATIIAENDATKLTGTGWATSKEEALRAALAQVHGQAVALAEHAQKAIRT